MTLERWSELPDETALHTTDDADACDVLVRDGPLVWVFRFTRIQPDYSHLHANVGVNWLTRAGELPHVYELPRAAFTPLHVDWRSGSSRETFERRLRGYYDPAKKTGVAWSRIVGFAAGRLEEFVLSTGDLQEPTVIESRDKMITDYMIRPIWPNARRPVIWYGQGESGKGIMAVAAGYAFCTGASFASLRTKELARDAATGNALPRRLVYIDYEDSFDEFNTRVNRYANGLFKAPPPTLLRFDPHGRLFIDVVHTLKAKVDALGGADGYVMDSAIPACGGDVLKPEPVGQFFNALSLLNKPAIVIAHETKDSPTSADAPFGSQLWRTLSCMTVNFAGSAEPRRNEAGDAVRDLLLKCTKANNVKRFGTLAFELSFSDDDADDADAATAAVWTRIRQIAPTDVSQDLAGKLTPTQQLVVALRDYADGATIAQLAEITGLSANAVRHSLARSDAFYGDSGGGKGRGNSALWRLRSSSNGNRP